MGTVPATADVPPGGFVRDSKEIPTASLESGGGGMRRRNGQRKNRRRDGHLRRRCVFEALEPRQLLAVNVLTSHNDLARDGLNSNETMLTPSNVGSGTFGQLLSYPVTGQVYAQPLYVSNLAIPGKGTHNVVFVVTQNNDVYAYDANSNAGVSGGLLWHVNLGPAAATPNTFFGNRYGPYHDINPQVGITSTPVIDLSTNTMYLDAFTNDTPGQNVYSHHIHALDITTGADKLTPMLVAAAVQGNGLEGNGTTITFSAELQLQRPALTLLNGVLYVTYSGYADTDPYHGWILGFNPTNLQLVSVFNDTPNLLPGGSENSGGAAGEGGIWMTGSGLASDGTSMFLLVGNGDFGVAQGDYGDSALKISLDPSSTQANPNIDGYGLKVADYFTPSNQLSLAQSDADLGSGGGIVLPDQPGTHPHEYIGSGKQGVVYLINRDSMSGYNTTDQVIQEVNLGHGNFDAPAYFNETVYYHAVQDVLKAYTLTNGMLSAAPSAQSTVSYAASGQGATPSISANGTANGIVWDLEYNGTHEVLHAYDATTLAELYNTKQNAARDQMGAGVKFAVPTVADGEVFVGSSGALTIYALLPPPTTAPLAPSSLAASGLSASQIQLTWVNNATNQAGFKIERSSDGVTFTQIAVAGASALSYTDTNLSPSTKYYYRIRATNTIGDSAYAGPVNATTPAVTGAVDLYHFDAGSGTTAVDSVGTNNGTLTGTTKPTWVAPGKIGAAALSFSGNGAFNQAVGAQSTVTLTGDLSPILGGTSSLDAWFKTTQAAPSGSTNHWQDPAITGVEQASGSNDINWGTLNTTGHIGLYVGDAGGVYSTNAVNNGQWHNIAMTRDATTGQVQLYIDGVLNGTGTFDVGNKTSHFSVIGALADVANDGVTPTGDNYFNGQLDEVRIYNTVLTTTDVQELAVIPTAPTLNSATANPGPVVHLAWTSPSSFAQSIEIDRKMGAAGTYSPLTTLGGGVTSYDDQTVTAGTQYFYVVKAIDLAGSSPASNELNVTPPVPTVVANSVFYNDSAFDGFNGSSNLNDDISVPADKQALLPGQTATFQNVTNYSKGINGIIIDVANLYNLPRFEDYAFQVSTDGATWTAAPSTSIINVYPGRGPNGSTQITMIWDDNVIQNEWLQVTVLANAHTGLASNDVFYYGNLIGATGASNTSTNVVVGPADVASIVADPHSPFSKAAITDLNDLNRDGQVNANDAILARDNAGNALPLITAPASGGGGAAPALGTSSPASEFPSPALELSPSSAPALGTSSSAAIAATPTQPLPASSPVPVAKTDSASAATSGSSLAVANEPPPQARLGRLAIVAAWESMDDANHGTAWWTADRNVETGTDASSSFAAAWFDELFSALSVGRRHLRG
jgi:Concanavalin A-like lectin/glucanases superfamily/Fibronectin type III domain